MKIKGKLLIECKNAEIINEAIKLENEGFIKTRVKKNLIEAESMANNPLSLLHTLDDFLNCVALAMKIVDK